MMNLKKLLKNRMGYIKVEKFKSMKNKYRNRDMAFQTIRKVIFRIIYTA